VRFAVCEGVLREGSFAADVALASAAGIAGLGVDAAAVDVAGAREARRVLDGEGVVASSYMGLDGILGDDGVALSLDSFAARLDVAAGLGAPAALVFTGAVGRRPQADAQAECREWLEQAAPLAVERGVRIMLEPMHPLMRQWSFVHTLRHALTLVDGLLGAGVVLDVGHVWWEHDLDVLIRDHVERIVSVQLTNVDSVALDELRYERAPLEVGDVPVGAIVATLEAAGYRGWYEDETLVRSPRDRRLDLLRSAREWFEAL
jgi:sugar phosphate isomerase/epimerase